MCWFITLDAETETGKDCFCRVKDVRIKVGFGCPICTNWGWGMEGGGS